jgi:hypothetical protein
LVLRRAHVAVGVFDAHNTVAALPSPCQQVEVLCVGVPLSQVPDSRTLTCYGALQGG